MVRRSCKTLFIPLYVVLVRPPLAYAMEANADINQLERVQRLATRVVRGLRHVPFKKGFAKSTSSRWNADATELASFRLTFSSAHLEPVYEGTPTEY